MMQSVHMNVSFADSYLKSYEALSRQERNAVDKSIKFFQENPRHPGLVLGKLEVQDFEPDLYSFRCNTDTVQRLLL
jgi:mRNA-degrading endonuclease RelE of RelBE toxin-antitoxin system